MPLPMDVTALNEIQPNGEAMTAIPMPNPFPKRRQAALKIDPEEVVRSVDSRATQILQDSDRNKFFEDRLQTYAKYRGWLEDKTYPWANCSNVHPPIMMMSELRANAGIHNVVMTQRPLVSAKASRRDNVAKEEKITNLIDTQIFLDPGPEIAERRLGDFISCALQDGNAVAYTPWVRDERDVTSVFYRPAPPAGTDFFDYAGQKVQTLFPKATLSWDWDEKKLNRIRLTYPNDKTGTAEVFSKEDGSLEIVCKHEETVYDGPIMLPLSIGAVLVPTRCENLQPPSEFNPTGAPYVFVLLEYTVGEIRRMWKAEKFNFLDDEGMEKILNHARSSAAALESVGDKPEKQLQEQKDLMEGREHRQPDVKEPEDVEHIKVEFWMGFDRWDLDGDELAEDAFWIIARDAKVLCEARYLTEKWPATKPYRPLAECVPIPVPGRWYGISHLKLGENLYDLIKGSFDIAYDSASITNLPFFFYSASSAFRAEIMKMAPGHGYPVPGVPRETVYLPNFPAKDQSFFINVIGLGIQLYDRLQSMGPLQSGQVPTGKASALRTFGTTIALLQQGDVRADQLLLRVFNGFRQVARNFHLMNRHLLPPGKEIKRVGWDGPAEQAYDVIEKMEDIDAEVEFDFRPDFLLSNPAVLSQALTSVLGMIGTPLAFQMGITDANLFYNAVKDYIRSLRLDAKKYTKRPQETGGPLVLAEEAINMISGGRMPMGSPLEPAEVHLQKLGAFVNSDQMGLLPAENVALLKGWMMQVAQLAQRDKIQAAAQQFQAMIQQGGGFGGQGVDTTVQEPPVQTQQQNPPPTGPEVMNA